MLHQGSGQGASEQEPEEGGVRVSRGAEGEVPWGRGAGWTEKEAAPASALSSSGHLISGNHHHRHHRHHDDSDRDPTSSEGIKGFIQGLIAIGGECCQV